jgi:hypothetical protein
MLEFPNPPMVIIRFFRPGPSLSRVISSAIPATTTTDFSTCCSECFYGKRRPSETRYSDHATFFPEKCDTFDQLDMKMQNKYTIFRFKCRILTNSSIRFTYENDKLMRHPFLKIMYKKKYKIRNVIC